MKLTRFERDWALYDWGNSVYSIIVITVIFPMYFKAIASDAGYTATESTALWGYANSLVTLIIAITSPLLGTIADYLGYKKKFFSVFLAIGIISTAFLFIIPESMMFVILGTFVLTSVGYSGANIFYDSFLVDVTMEERLDRVSAYGYAFGYIGSTIPFIFALFVIALASDGTLPLTQFEALRFSFLIAAIWWAAFSIPMLKNITQAFGIPREQHFIRKSFDRLKDTFKNIKQYKPPFYFLIAYFFYIDGVDTIIRMATTYGLDLGIDQNTILIVLLVTQFIAAPATLLFGLLTKKFTPRTIIFFAIAVYLGISIYAYFMNSAFDFWFIAILVGLVQGGIQSMSRSYFARLIPKERSNEFFGLFNVFGRFAAILGPAIVATVTTMTGRTQTGAASVIIVFIIGGLLLTRVKDETTI